MNKQTKKFFKKFKFVRKLHQDLIGQYIEEKQIGIHIDEITPLMGERCSSATPKVRINILVPTLRKNMVFGGISTAIKFFDALSLQGDYDKRIITTDSDVQPEDIDCYQGAVITPMNKEKREKFQIVSVNDRTLTKLSVRKQDIFIATSWWSAYILNDLIKWQNKEYGQQHPMIYLIQDYEPGFYPWSSRFMLADSTYRSDIPTIAVYNTKILADYFKQNAYVFTKEFYFEPVLNERLAHYLDQANDTIRKKQIIVYGRPGVDRNCFEIIVGSLRKLLEISEEARTWDFISLGEAHKSINLEYDKELISMGKVSLDQYAQVMCESSIGLSLMNSPHPSYPPLEMSTFGVKTITNTYANKDLAGFNNNIISVENCSYETIAKELLVLIRQWKRTSETAISEHYVGNQNVFENIAAEVHNYLNTLRNE